MVWYNFFKKCSSTLFQMKKFVEWLEHAEEESEEEED